MLAALLFKMKKPDKNEKLIEKLLESQEERRKNPDLPAEKLKSPDSNEVRDAFEELNLDKDVLKVGLSVKLPKDIDPSKKYEIKIRQKETKRQLGQRLLDRDCAWDAEKIEDEEFLNYDPGFNVPPFDARFPHQNATPACEQNYMDYHRCKKMMGDDYQDCAYFKHVYMKNCPMAWYTAWDEQMEEGVYAYKI